MPTISYDGQSLVLDGRRVWLVSGSIQYGRVPHQLWAQRIAAAKQAGLNCIETCAFWNLHEPQPGRFNFEGDADVRRFVEMVGEAGMYCLFRPGPFIGADWDFGGLPPWLNLNEDIKLRQASAPMLEASARYLGAIMAQVRDLQITAPRPSNDPPGPVLMVQAENQWLCHNPEQADKYLGELVRYLRENGCSVPINISNNLWQRVDGTIDTWSADRRLLADLRQLQVIQPESPRFVQYQAGQAHHWGESQQRASTAAELEFQLVEMLAAGAQYNLSVFSGGTNFGFHAGRDVGAPGNFVTTSYDNDAPLSEGGGRSDKYLAVKRVSTFASQFAHVLAHVEPRAPHAITAPSATGRDVAVIDQEGPQGSTIFVLRGSQSREAEVELLLRTGVSLTVPMGDDQVAWVVLDANLAGIARLTYTNLRAWAFVDRQMLVLFGPAGVKGVVSINDSPLPVTVPTGKEPVVEQHEELTVVVLNQEQVDAAYVVPGGLVVGAGGLDDEMNPLPLRGWASCTTITAAGETTTKSVSSTRKPPAPRLADWQQAEVTTLLDGSDESYNEIPGPAPLEALGCPYGYGWYRLSFKGSRTATILAPQAGDRLHLFSKGEPLALLGLGPGAQDEPTDLALGGEVVVLADNLGRFSSGWSLGESKGLFGHLHSVKAVTLGKPTVTAGRAPDPFALGGFFTLLRRDDRPMAEALTWTVKASGRKAMILTIQNLPVRAMVLLNDAPIGLYDPYLSAGVAQFVLEHEEGQLKGGNNELKLALFGSADAVKSDVGNFVQLYQSADVASAKAQWSFTPWTVPAPEAFEPRKKQASDLPCWHRGSFNISRIDGPLWVEPRGLSKGQIYLNGHNVGRYFVATASGEAVPPQSRYYLPEPWLKTDEPNELLLFEEHGKDPSKVQLVYDDRGPFV